MERKIKIGIKKAREKLNMSQSELAAELGVDTTVIKGWEAGAAFPTVNTLKHLSNLLKTSLEMLIFSEERKPLDISKLTDEQKIWIIDFYKTIIEKS